MADVWIIQGLDEIRDCETNAAALAIPFMRYGTYIALYHPNTDHNIYSDTYLVTVHLSVNPNHQAGI